MGICCQSEHFDSNEKIKLKKIQGVEMGRKEDAEYKISAKD